MLVRKAMADGLPATIYRPGIVVGDSTHRRHPEVRRALLPRHLPASPAAGRAGPGARRPRRGQGLPGAARLRGRRDGRALGARPLAGPDLRADRPPPAHRPRAGRRPSPTTSASAWSGCRCRCGPVHLLVGSVPGMERLMGLPAESLDYFASPTTYATTQTTTDLEGTGRDLPAVRVVRRPTARLHARPPRGRRPRHGLSPPGPAEEEKPRDPHPDHHARRHPAGRERQPRPAPSATTTPGSPSSTGASGSCAWAPTATSTPPATWSATGRADADAIAVTGVREARAAGLYDGDLDAVEKVMAAAGDDVPVTDGHALHDVLQEWAIRHLRTDLPGYFDNARTVVLGGTQPRPHRAGAARVDPQPRVRRPAAAPRPAGHAALRPAARHRRRRRGLAAAPPARRRARRGCARPARRRATPWPARPRATATSSSRPTTS